MNNMEVRDVETGFVIKIAKGEKVLATLTDFCARRGIKGGALHAIGAIKNIELGYYSVAKREYFFKLLPEDREVASMTGNIALVDGKPFIHAHGVFTAMDDSMGAVGGHLKEAEVAATLEVYLTPFAVPFERKFDEETGLKLLDI